MTFDMPRLAVLMLVLAAGAAAGCSGSYTATGTSGSSGGPGAGDPSICSKKPPAACYAGASSAASIQKCEAFVADAKCGASYQALFECALAAATSQSLCPGDHAASGTCTNEINAYTSCAGSNPGSTTTVEEVDGGSSTGDASSTCHSGYSCSSGASCTCIGGPAKGASCQETDPQSAATYCEKRCYYCD
jgi:hypothetical protein